MARRTVLFAVAIVVALLATASMFVYVSSVDDRAIADAQPVEVLIAKNLIAAGTSAQDASEKGLLTLSRVPRRSVPEGALSNISSVSRLVALSDIYPGEMLLRAKFSEQQTTGALTIPGNKLAVAVELGDPQRVAGYVVPGSEVAVFVTYEPDAAAGQSKSVESTRLLLARIPVIAVGATTLRAPKTDKAKGDEATEEPVAATVLTLAVSTKEAEKLVHGAQTGKLYFGLLSSKSAAGGAGSGVDNRNLFG